VWTACHNRGKNPDILFALALKRVIPLFPVKFVELAPPSQIFQPQRGVFSTPNWGSVEKNTGVV